MAPWSAEQREEARRFLVEEALYNDREVACMTDDELNRTFRLCLANLDDMQAVSDPAAKAALLDDADSQSIGIVD